MARHGSVRWSEIAAALSRNPSCPKLAGYWRFYDCRYHKGSGTCAEPHHIAACPLPRHPLRNGHLNQMAYSLFLFMRDVADGDLVAWIDAQFGSANSQSANRLASLREAIIGPLRNVYGVADKVLAMALADLLLSAGQQRPVWREVGATLVAVDTLVHNFLHRTGILRRLGAEHPYGERCYRAGGCAGILGLLAAEHRCPPVQSGLPGDVSAVRAERDLAVLRRERPRHLQRQSHRRRHPLRQRALPAVSPL